MPPTYQETVPITEDCKLVVTCKMQNRNATDKLNQQCRKIAWFATVTVLCKLVGTRGWRIMLA